MEMISCSVSSDPAVSGGVVEKKEVRACIDKQGLAKKKRLPERAGVADEELSMEDVFVLI
jgi:hypothetical protein